MEICKQQNTKLEHLKDASVSFWIKANPIIAIK